MRKLPLCLLTAAAAMTMAGAATTTTQAAVYKGMLVSGGLGNCFNSSNCSVQDLSNYLNDCGQFTISFPENVQITEDMSGFGGSCPDYSLNDCPWTDCPAPDFSVPGFPEPDFSLPGFPGADFPTPDFPTPDFPTPDFPTPDFPTPDFPQPDNPIPDNPKPDVPTPDEPEYPGQGQDHTDDSDAYIARIVELVNEERSKAGLSPLAEDDKEDDAAAVRAQEIVTSFSHTRPDGRSFSSVLDEFDVSYQAAGENIAYGQQTPENVMQGWMDSEGHRANILNPSFKRIGVGHFESSDGTDYWAQLFTD